ncbi:MAG: CoA pyrophosphatase, partial [Caulobacteraceae bacterium]|nr:CoA pyrophosphatase [Caulobacteraceae bacterium]
MNPAEVRAWIRGRLDPIESYDPSAPPPRSDFDLNPGHAPAPRPLKAAAVLVPLVEREAGVTVLLTR